MRMQRAYSGMWVGFCPPREASPYSSEDDVDEEHEMGAWDKGLEERFGRIVTIVDSWVRRSLAQRAAA